MTDVTSQVAGQTREGVRLLTIAVSALFIFAFWKTAGISLNFSAGNAEELKEFIYEELEDRAGGRASIVDQLIRLSFGILGIYLHFLNKSRTLFTWARAWPLLLVIALIAFSVLWSDVPQIALRRVVKQMLLVAMLAGIVMEAGSLSQVYRLAIACTGLAMVADWVAVLLFPGLFINAAGDFLGLHGHKNTAGVFAMMSVFVWFAAARCADRTKTRVFLYLGALLWFVFLLGTYSRTSILSTAVAIPSIVALHYCLRRPRFGLIAGFGALFAALCAVFFLIALDVKSTDFVAALEGEKTTLSGRALVWHIAYQAFLQNVVGGTGYGSLWSIGGLPPSEKYANLPMTGFLLGLTQGHSGYFDILATLGTIGAAVFLIFILTYIWINIRALAATREDEDGTPIAEFSGLLLLGALIHNLTQTTFLQHNLIWASLVFCFLMLCARGYPGRLGVASRASQAPEPPDRAFDRASQAGRPMEIPRLDPRDRLDRGLR